MASASRSVSADRGTALVELLGPLGTLGGLEPELVAELHDPALLDQFLHHPEDVLAELGAVGCEVFDEEVGEYGRCGAHTGVADPVVRELGNEKYQRSGS